MSKIHPTALVMLACLAGLGGCGKDDPAAIKPDSDPALVSALADPVMVDTDLSSQNLAAAAIVAGGPPVIELPAIERTPQAIEAARDEARRLAGGSLKSAPFPEDGESETAAGVTAAQLAASVRGVGGTCPAKAEYAMAWSLNLPAPLAIYPRGHMQEAAGTDRDGCRLRVASFVTPVDTDEVVDFYYTRLAAAGIDARHWLANGVHALDGNKARATYAVRASKLENGLTRVDLVSNGS